MLLTLFYILKFPLTLPAKSVWSIKISQLPLVKKELIVIRLQFKISIYENKIILGEV